MKINILLASALVLSIVACDKKADQTTNEPAPTAATTTEQQASAPTPSQEPISTSSVAGTYETTLPCADCEGIKTSLTLTEQGQYTLTQEYLGKGKPETSKGKYEIANNVIKIEVGPQETIRYKVVNGTIVQLDQEGNEITKDQSDFADMYIYKKQ